MEELISQLSGRAKDRRGKYRGTAQVRLVEKQESGIRLDIIRKNSLEYSINFSKNSFQTLFKDLLIQKTPEHQETIRNTEKIQQKLQKSFKLLEKQQKPVLIEKSNQELDYRQRREQYGKALPDVLYIIYQNWLEWFNLHDFRPIYNSYYRIGKASRWLNRLDQKQYLHTRKSRDEELKKDYRLTDQAIERIEWWKEKDLIST
jgi:hypothetical protein